MSVPTGSFYPGAGEPRDGGKDGLVWEEEKGQMRRLGMSGCTGVSKCFSCLWVNCWELFSGNIADPVRELWYNG